MSPLPGLEAPSACAEAVPLPQAQQLARLWLLPLALPLPQVSRLQSRAGGCWQGGSRVPSRQGQASRFFTGAKTARGGPKCRARALAAARQVPADPKGLCPDVLEEVAIWRQTEGEGAVPVSLGRQAQP